MDRTGFLSGLYLSSLVVLLSGCGAMDAIDATKSMPTIMQQMSGKMDQTNSRLDKTDKAIHNQTLAVALDTMLKKENSEHLFPPTSMVPAGKVFADEMTALELVQLIYTMSRDINEVKPDDGLKVDGKFPDAVVQEYNHAKMVKLNALMVISGLAPRETIETMIHDQVTEGGRFEPFAYNALALRAAFIKGFILDEGLLAYHLTNPGMIDEAVKYTEDLEAITTLSFADRISMKTHGMINEENDVEITLDKKMTAPIWARLDRAMTEELEAKYQDLHQEKIAGLRSQIDARLRVWGLAPAPRP